VEETIPKALSEKKATFIQSPISHELKCPHADLVKFWKPTTVADMNYKTPYYTEGAEDRYITFEPGVSLVL
jgi:hypothetical protein